MKIVQACFHESSIFVKTEPIQLYKLFIQDSVGNLESSCVVKTGIVVEILVEVSEAKTSVHFVGFACIGVETAGHTYTRDAPASTDDPSACLLLNLQHDCRYLQALSFSSQLLGSRDCGTVGLRASLASHRNSVWLHFVLYLGKVDSGKLIVRHESIDLV